MYANLSAKNNIAFKPNHYCYAKLFHKSGEIELSMIDSISLIIILNWGTEYSAFDGILKR